MSKHSIKKSEFQGWSLRDEAMFINGIGSFSREAAPSTHNTQTLLYRYRKALEKRTVISFCKADALILIDKRLADIAQQRTMHNMATDLTRRK